MSLRVVVRILRWVGPGAVTGVLVLLLGHKSHPSSAPLLFSRYSLWFFLLLVSLGLLALLCWWIVLDKGRYQRFLNNLSRPPILNFGFAFLILGVLVVLDFFFGLSFDPILHLLPLAVFILVIAMGILAARNPREMIIGLAMVFISVALGIYMAEGVFRWVLLEDKVPVKEVEFEKYIAFTWPRKIEIEKNAHTYRILGVSDSFGQAGRADNYHYVLEKLMRDAGLDVEVVNLSGEEYAPTDQLELIRRFGRRYQPDLVLHGFFVGNDFCAPKPVLLSYHGISVRAEKTVPYRPKKLMLSKWLKRYIKFIYDRRLRKAELTRGEAAGCFSQDSFLQIESRSLSACEIQPKPYVKRNRQKAMDLVDAIRKEAENMGAGYVMVIHPDHVQVDDELFQQVVVRYGLDMNEYELDLPQRFLKKYCSVREVPCLDLLPILKIRHNEKKMYIFRDTHYNKDGNAFVAEEIFKFLKTHNDIFSF